MIFFFLLASICYGQTVEVLKSQKVESDFKLSGSRYGGISGLSFSDGFIWAVTDDRGRYGPPRIYRHSLNGLAIKVEKELSLVNLKDNPTLAPVMDLEALIRFKDGTFLLSSEGDFNKKPRTMPFLKMWSEQKLWFIEVLIPDSFLPEKIGMQTKGLQNNSGFEALALSPDEKSLYVMSELPLFQNQNSEIEFLNFQLNDKSWELKSRLSYQRDLPPKGVVEVMRGVSEILYWKKDYLLVLERFARLSKKRGVFLGAELFSVNLSDLKKKKLISLDEDLAANWEGLAWGPDLSDGRKLLLLVSDNNFEKTTPTQFLFLAFKEENP